MQCFQNNSLISCKSQATIPIFVHNNPNTSKWLFLWIGQSQRFFPWILLESGLNLLESLKKHFQDINYLISPLSSLKCQICQNTYWSKDIAFLFKCKNTHFCPLIIHNDYHLTFLWIYGLYSYTNGIIIWNLKVQT